MLRDTSVVKKSDFLETKQIAVGVGGGIGAVACVKIIRELRRHGASVTVFMSKSSKEFITPTSLSWASDKAVIERASFKVEYLNSFDLVIIAPLTAHTLAKIALGLTSNVVSLLAYCQIAARRKLVLVPTMHELMSEHPLYSLYQKQLIDWGAAFYVSEVKESKLKMPEPEAFVSWLQKIL